VTVNLPWSFRHRFLALEMNLKGISDFLPSDDSARCQKVAEHLGSPLSTGVAGKSPTELSERVPKIPKKAFRA
jgi:hypothetical protein